MQQINQSGGKSNHGAPASTSGQSEGQPAKVFELAQLFVSLRFRAEDHWCEENDANGVNLRQHDVIVGCARRAVEDAAGAIAKQVQDPTAFSPLTTVLGKFSKDYEDAWQDPTRTRNAEKLAQSDPEFYASRRTRLLETSTLRSSVWPALSVAMNKVVDSLDRECQLCFRLGELLEGEIWPTVLGGQRLREAGREVELLRYDFKKQVQAVVDRLSEYHPYLARLKFDLGGCNERSAHSEILRYSKEVLQLLRDPASRPGYLDLNLDRHRGRVCRRDRCTELKGRIPWEILILLEKSGENYVSSEELKKAWHHFMVADSALHKQISTLRSALMPLKIGIGPSRGTGWRLEEIPRRRRKSR
ncbi:MAG: hypothetical protein ABSD28_20225 [Tepidisphaeraceae bacterium]|jgi:hypothetical protein